ncbi:DUF1453 domain-containing protein [Streptomyces sp. Qhu-G9]|uniref:DUF1453 domain-containing protein n=1 Tax=Streptomyces sp. Qhu-G9 TaxID=3452799 RepID=UPI0022AC4864|nr:DUF1453 domain-containing protein [Streptomyces aurantiacus]WAU86543.1 DUF1453 domain-containing protein [Streptomyces aurantiacus]
MSGLVDVLAILAVAVLVIARQFRPRRIETDRRWWVVPAVLVFLALREPGLLDPRHQTESVLLLGAELLIALATGAGWAWTTRMWTTPDGAVWTRSSKASALVWITGIALRAGLFGLGVVLGLRQGTSALLLGLALTLLARSRILAWRAHGLRPVTGQSTAYGEDLPRPLRKERV